MLRDIKKMTRVRNLVREISRELRNIARSSESLLTLNSVNLIWDKRKHTSWKSKLMVELSMIRLIGLKRNLKVKLQYGVGVTLTFTLISLFIELGCCCFFFFCMFLGENTTLLFLFSLQLYETSGRYWLCYIAGSPYLFRKINKYLIEKKKNLNWIES